MRSTCDPPRRSVEQQGRNTGQGRGVHLLHLPRVIHFPPSMQLIACVHRMASLVRRAGRGVLSEFWVNGRFARPELPCGDLVVLPPLLNAVEHRGDRYLWSKALLRPKFTAVWPSLPHRDPILCEVRCEHDFSRVRVPLGHLCEVPYREASAGRAWLLILCHLPRLVCFQPPSRWHRCLPC